MKRVEYYKQLKEEGTLRKLLMIGTISHVPFLMIDVYDYYNAIKDKMHSPIKDTCIEIGIKRTYCHTLLNAANESIF